MTHGEAASYFKGLIVCADWVDASYIDGVKVEAIRTAIEAMKERKAGKWIRDRYCSNCDWSNEDVYFTSNWTGKYCPNCGIKMEGAEE